MPENLLDSNPDEDGPQIELGAADLDEDIDEDTISEDDIEADKTPLAPSSRSMRVQATQLRKPRSSEEHRLPPVIVNTAAKTKNAKAMVQALLDRHDTAMIEKLAEMGQPAVMALIAHFPGPLTSELRGGTIESPPRASECGPILRTLVRIGEPAVPFLVVRTADADPVVRSWATRLLGEIPNAEGARAVVRRLVEKNADVRRAALAAGRLMASSAEARDALREGLTSVALDPSHSENARHATIESLADLREARAVPELIRLVGGDNQDIAKSAQWALVTLTRQDFGRSRKDWMAWWAEHGHRHRIEWLIDALMHDVQDVRRAAGDELKSLTKEYFGYYDDLPEKERAKARDRYREWWDAKGKARFTSH